MAQLAAAAAVVAAVGTLVAGNNANEASKAQQKQLKQRAGQERAAGQAAAVQARRQANYVQSRLQAVAASSGAGALDKTVLDLSGGITKEGEYQALSALYSGNERANTDIYAGQVARTEGKNAQTESYYKAATYGLAAYNSIAGGGESLYSKYGQGGPENYDGATDLSGANRYAPYA